VKPLSEQTLYEILEIRDDAPSSEIERAYQRLRALFGPGSLATYTLMASEEMADLGRRIEEARSVLLDPVARAGYDARLASGTPPPQAGRTDDSATTVSATAPPGFRAEMVAARTEASPQPPLPEPAAAVAPPAPQPPAPLLPHPSPPPPAPVIVQAAAPAQAAMPPERQEAGEPAAAATPAPRPAEKVVLPEAARWTGEILRRAREARGLTIPQVAERTRITRHHIENIEADRFAKLPAGVYLRGMLASIARELRLDGQKVSKSYMEHMAASLGDSR